MCHIFRPPILPRLYRKGQAYNTHVAAACRAYSHISGLQADSCDMDPNGVNVTVEDKDPSIVWVQQSRAAMVRWCLMLKGQPR